MAVHRIQRHRYRATAGHGDRPGKFLRPFVGNGTEDAGIPLFIYQRHRCCRTAANCKGYHLQFRERPAHAVTVHQWQTQTGGSRDREHRVHAACLNGHKGVDRFAIKGRDGFVQRTVLFPSDGLFTKHGGSAHHGNGNDERVIRHFIRVQKGNGPALLNRADSDQLAHIRITAAACPQQSRAQRDVFDFGNSNLTQVKHSFSESSLQAAPAGKLRTVIQPVWVPALPEAHTRSMLPRCR